MAGREIDGIGIPVGGGGGPEAFVRVEVSVV